MPVDPPQKTKYAWAVQVEKVPNIGPSNLYMLSFGIGMVPSAIATDWIKSQRLMKVIIRWYVVESFCIDPSMI